MGSCGLVMSLDELVQFSGNGAPAKLPDQFAGGVICGTLRVEEIPIPELARSHRVFQGQRAGGFPVPQRHGFGVSRARKQRWLLHSAR